MQDVNILGQGRMLGGSWLRKIRQLFQRLFRGYDDEEEAQFINDCAATLISKKSYLPCKEVYFEKLQPGYNPKCPQLAKYMSQKMLEQCPEQADEWRRNWGAGNTTSPNIKPWDLYHYVFNG